ncbi:MAG: hypothetical protein WCO56_14980 [Verrucomicrobiota bacterium]
MSRALELSEELLKWYWQFGCQRAGNYSIHIGGWTKQLYDLQQNMILAREAMQNPRPAFAVWGPSQTGKSTLMSNYLDRLAITDTAKGIYGEKSALHWEGGDPAYFQIPSFDDIEDPQQKEQIQQDIYDKSTVMNPFNGGRDASACLSRFVSGSRDGSGGLYRVKNPKFPVEIKFVTRSDLLHALGRGYCSECLGATANRNDHIEWTRQRLEEEMGKVMAEQAGSAGKIPKPSPEAFTLLYEFYKILIDLEFAGLREYKKLREQEGSVIEKDLGFLFNEVAFLAKLETVENLVTRVLWDGFEPITQYWRRLEAKRQEWAEKWKNKTIHCSHAVAGLMLDMDSCWAFFMAQEPGDPTSKAAIIRRRIRDLGYREEGDAVYIGVGEPNKFRFSPEDYSIFQGLVWELIIPLNPANILPGTFNEFLLRSDLLDFPGVGNDPDNPVTKINCETTMSADEAEKIKDLKPEELAAKLQGKKGLPLSPQMFFVKVLKRGKTSSIVTTYTKRMSIDGFCIFQWLDKFPPVNASQVRTGIETWWKTMVPDYYAAKVVTNTLERSPLPLNLGLCWWADMINEAPVNANYIITNKKDTFENYGFFSKPSVCTTFALNYYRINRGNIKEGYLTPGGKRYEIIKREDVFRNQFENTYRKTNYEGKDISVSLASFECMVRDQETGGADFFFSQLKVQAEEVRRNDPKSNRLLLLQGREKELVSELVRLLFRDANLFPEKQVKDKRRIYLDQLDAAITESIKRIERKDPKDPRAKQLKEPYEIEEGLRVLDYVLREGLNVAFNDLDRIPPHTANLHEQYVYGQYQNWIVRQVERYRKVINSPASRPPVLPGAAVTDKAALEKPIIELSPELLRECLEAMVASVRPSEVDGTPPSADTVNTAGIAEWLKWLVRCVSKEEGLNNYDLRPQLSIKLANLLLREQGLVYSGGSAPADKTKQFSEATVMCPSYQSFIRDFYEGHLERLKRRQVKGLQRPDDIPGDKELMVVLDRFGLQRPDDLSEAVPGMTEALMK